MICLSADSDLKTETHAHESPYGHYEVQRFLLSNLRWWMEECNFDGFRFLGVPDMLYYLPQSITTVFSEGYDDYFRPRVDFEAVAYLMMANVMLHKLYPGVITIANTCGMPGTCVPVEDGGHGFNYRLNDVIPKFWLKFLKEGRGEEDMPLDKLCSAFWVHRRDGEPVVVYAEGSDQCFVREEISFDAAMMQLEQFFGFLSSDPAHISLIHETDRVIVFERAGLLFAFNFHGTRTHSFYLLGVEVPGAYQLVLSSDLWEFGGNGRIFKGDRFFTEPMR